MLANLFGGRPMRRKGFAFTDIVTGKPVYYWTDRLGRNWLALGAWSLFRVVADQSSAPSLGEKRSEEQ